MEENITKQQICQGMERLRQTPQGTAILSSAGGNFFNVTEICLVDDRRGGRCFHNQDNDTDVISIGRQECAKIFADFRLSAKEQSEFLAVLLAHEFTHARQYNNMPSLIPGKASTEPTPATEYMMEADCRLNALLTAAQCSSSAKVLNAALNTQCPDYYMTERQRNRFTQKIGKTASVEELQQIAREGLKAILTKGKEKGMDFTDTQGILAIYNPQIYGKPKEFLPCIPGIDKQAYTKCFNLLHQQERHWQDYHKAFSQNNQSAYTPPAPTRAICASL